MPVSAYRYAGAHLAQAASSWDIQKQNMGMLEISIDQFVPGAREMLILALQSFTIPGREVGVGDLPYLNGVSRYPQKANARGNITVIYRDFPAIGVRSAIQRWFRLVYDEETGIMLPAGLVKASGHLILFQSNGTAERHARIEGIFPTKEPEVLVDYGNGDHMTMTLDLSVDRVIWEPSLASPINA